MDRRFTLTLEGLRQDDGNLALGDFVHQLQALQRALTRIDRTLSERRQPSTVFRVVDLSHSSPAAVVLEGVARRSCPDLAGLIVVNLFAALRQIEAGDPGSETLEPDLLEDLLQMSQPVGERLQRVSLSHSGLHVGLGSEFRKRIEALLETTTFGIGFLRGMLEAINVHASANLFKLYPAIGPRSVSCHFPASLTSDAVGAVGHYVEVRGVLKYRARQPFAHEVDVKALERLDQDSRIGWEALRGIAPTLTEGKSAEDWIRGRREVLEGELSILASARSAA